MNCVLLINFPLVAQYSGAVCYKAIVNLPGPEWTPFQQLA